MVAPGPTLTSQSSNSARTMAPASPAKVTSYVRDCTSWRLATCSRHAWSEYAWRARLRPDLSRVTGRLSEVKRATTYCLPCAIGDLRCSALYWPTIRVDSGCPSLRKFTGVQGRAVMAVRRGSPGFPPGWSARANAQLRRERSLPNHRLCWDNKGRSAAPDPGGMRTTGLGCE